MISDKTISSVVKYCVDNLDLKRITLGEEYFYSSLPLCAIDSVFSIGVRYQNVQNVINRICEHYHVERMRKNKTELPEIQSQSPTTSGMLKLLQDDSIEILVQNVFRNKQRTSTRGGKYKVEATIEFLKVLQDFGIEYFQDVPKVILDEDFDSSIKKVHGQSSGISLKYFFMLAGSKDLIKPDRMIKRFLINATGNEYNDQECQEILGQVTLELAKEVAELNARLLDYAIWNYQRLKS